MPDDPRTCLVTGALGAIGAWTVRSLLDRGHHVVTFDLAGASDHRLRFALGDEELEEVTRLSGDVTEFGAVERALDEHGITDVIHLAALQVPFVRADPIAGARVNVTGTVNVLEAVRRSRVSRPVVYASSIAALAPGGGHPSTLYGVFKRANEGTAERYFADYGVSSVGLRPHTVYGPGRDQGVTSAPTAAILSSAAGKPYAIPFGGALQLQYVADAGEAFVRAGESAGEGASVHNLDGPVVPMRDLIALVERLKPGAAGLLSAGDEPLPFPAEVDATSFTELVGGPTARPVEEGVRDALERFAELLAAGWVRAPEPA